MGGAVTLTIDDIITEIEVEEGGAKVTVNPTDRGGRTQYGIAEASNPAAWADGVVTEQEARAIYLKKYVEVPGFDTIPPPLQVQLIDFGVNSGPMIAIMKLQTILGVPSDGVLGPGTRAALAKADIMKVNNLLVAARIRMIGQIVKKTPSQLTFLGGWLDRSLEFLC